MPKLSDLKPKEESKKTINPVIKEENKEITESMMSIDNFSSEDLRYFYKRLTGKTIRKSNLEIKKALIRFLKKDIEE